MVLTASTMLPLGSVAPSFRLPDPEGYMVSIDDFEKSPVLLVMFICNHCPYVKHIQHVLANLARDYMPKGVSTVAINSNDVVNYPDDNLKKMEETAMTYGYTFPYLFDETQKVAKAYRAACTPDFYVFDKERKLVYRGQFDNSRPGNSIPVTGHDLASALDAALEGRDILDEQKPSVGCNIKWKRGNEPDYFK